MAYFVTLFSPQTYEAFSNSDRNIAGFKPRQRRTAQRVHIGDKLICYITRLSRWCGILEVVDDYLEDSTPIFMNENDPFTIRLPVDPLVWLPKERAVPMQEEIVWNNLSFTGNAARGSSAWTGTLRNSLNSLTGEDGRFLENLLRSQANGGRFYELDEREYQRHIRHTVRVPAGEALVSVPLDEEIDDEVQVSPTIYESTRIQALLASIGAQMGLKIWVPRNNRTAVQQEIGMLGDSLVTTLPLNYHGATFRTIEEIDVIWLRRQSIVRAFEVEHSTAIYSGILRMADLLVLQPNMDIKLHIVAPYERREKVFDVIKRPVFANLDAGPLSEKCTYLSYESVREIAGQRNLARMRDDIVEDYEEEVE